MKNILGFILVILPALLHAQQDAGVIYPGSAFTNQSPDTLFYLTKEKLETIMDQEGIYKEQISTCQTQVEICDTALALKCREADDWHTKLLETDNQLQSAEIKNAKQEHRFRVWNKIWFGGGLVVGWVICAVL